MTTRRSYGQYCAVSMALDRIGNRWTVLIIRDLMSGPTRFVDLLRGLPGIASNLLTERLRQLEVDGIVTHSTNEHGVALYGLTPLGEQTRPILVELGMWGRSLAPPAEPKQPVIYRSLAVALQAMLSAGLPASGSARVDLDVEGQHFDVAVEPKNVAVAYRRPLEADAQLRAMYDALAQLLTIGTEPARAPSVLTFAKGDTAAAAIVTDILAVALNRTG